MDQSRDFSLLQRTNSGSAGRNRRAMWSLLGLLLLLVASVVALVLYLNNFEAEEEERRRAADAQWLEQGAQFHFRRLEDDLLALARRSVLGGGGIAPMAAQDSVNDQGGLLWRAPGVILSHGWRSVGGPTGQGHAPERWELDWRSHPANAQALTTMTDTASGLRRAAYAGPMRQPNGAVGDVVWLAVPLFERGKFAGNYLAAISMDSAALNMVPTWFQSNHVVRLLTDDVELVPLPAPGDTAYRASMNLPGTELYLRVDPVQASPATVPRTFLLVALLFLSGMLVSLYVLRRDFLKRQKVQALLQAEVALRKAMENSVTIGMRAWDPSGKILYVNHAFCNMVGYSAPELLGRSAPMPYWPVDRVDEIQLVHRKIITRGTVDEGVEVQFQHRDGRFIDVLIHEAPLTAVTGESLGWMSSVLDISERKRAQRIAASQQDKLEASGRLVAVGEVASTLAHELNQPLGALSSFANGLLNRLHGGNITLLEMEPIVVRIASLAERAGNIIQHVNAFARRREISRMRLELTELVRRVLFSGEGANRSVAFLPAPSPVWIEADALLLEHLINNLVGNALDWAQQGKGKARVQVRVQVMADADNGLAGLVVSDSGPGVNDEDLPHIFNAFVSLKEGGMGMGLAICRSIAEAHHGRIGVGRDADLGGARFTVWLPLADSPSNAVPLPPFPSPE